MTTSANVALLVFASLWLVAAAVGKRQLVWRKPAERRPKRRRWSSGSEKRRTT